MNAFRQTADGRLDRQFLRICAVYRLLEKRRIGRVRALQLLAERGVRNASATVDLWAGNYRHAALRDMLP